MTAIDVKNFKRGAAFIPGATSIPDSRVGLSVHDYRFVYRV